MSEEKKIVVYHYTRGKDTFTTPNVEIAISRRSGDEDIQVETIQGEETHMSVLVLGN